MCMGDLHEIYTSRKKNSFQALYEISTLILAGSVDEVTFLTVKKGILRSAEIFKCEGVFHN